MYIYTLSVHPVIKTILNLPDYGRMTEARVWSKEMTCNLLIYNKFLK